MTIINKYTESDNLNEIDSSLCITIYALIYLILITLAL